MKRTRVLLNWDTSRKDLLEPFIELKDEIEFIIVWGEFEDVRFHPFRQVFFGDYKSPYAMLDAIKPDKVVFFNINTFPGVALNLAAKNRGIPTFVMHHGIHHADNLEINRQYESQGFHKPRKIVSNSSVLRFYLSSIRPRNLSQVFPMLRYAWVRQRRDRVLANEKCVFEGRLPTRYINLSPHNAIITKKIDHIEGDDRFIYIGHPFFDRILRELNALKNRPTAAERYFLLVDFANREQNFAFRQMTAEGKKKFYQRLSAFARSKGCRLKIKLHPFGYDSPYNYRDDNIDLVKDADMAELIHNAEQCFSFFSTLIIPIIYHKGFCNIFFMGSDRNMQQELVDLGVARKLTVDNFEEEMEMIVQHTLTHNEGYQAFIEMFLYITDGKATQRLSKVLTSNEVV